jgi:hypothetical protein
MRVRPYVPQTLCRTAGSSRSRCKARDGTKEAIPKGRVRVVKRRAAAPLPAVHRRCSTLRLVQPKSACVSRTSGKYSQDAQSVEWLTLCSQADVVWLPGGAELNATGVQKPTAADHRRT